MDVTLEILDVLNPAPNFVRAQPRISTAASESSPDAIKGLAVSTSASSRNTFVT